MWQVRKSLQTKNQDSGRYVAAHPRKVELLSTHSKNTITTISILHIRMAQEYILQCTIYKCITLILMVGNSVV